MIGNTVRESEVIHLDKGQEYICMKGGAIMIEKTKSNNRINDYDSMST